MFDGCTKHLNILAAKFFIKCKLKKPVVIF